MDIEKTIELTEKEKNKIYEICDKQSAGYQQKIINYIEQEILKNRLKEK